MNKDAKGCITPILIFLVLGVGGVLLGDFVRDAYYLIPDVMTRIRISFGISSVGVWGGIILGIVSYVVSLKND